LLLGDLGGEQVSDDILRLMLAVDGGGDDLVPVVGLRPPDDRLRLHAIELPPTMTKRSRLSRYAGAFKQLIAGFRRARQRYTGAVTLVCKIASLKKSPLLP
jgi:hypothetical protein